MFKATYYNDDGSTFVEYISYDIFHDVVETARNFLSKNWTECVISVFDTESGQSIPLQKIRFC